MKANEAPEKIYLFENPITETPDDRWLSKRSCEEDIEYTRSDAFVDKACEWLENINLSDYVYIKHTSPTTFVKYNQDKLVEDFRKAMRQ